MDPVQKPNFIIAKQNLVTIIRYMTQYLGMPRESVRILFDLAMAEVEAVPEKEGA